MEDDHVDRPGVEERQRLKLTGTNSSIGLIVLIPYAHRETRWSPALTHERPLRGLCSARAPVNRRRAVALAGLRPKCKWSVLTHACSALRAALRGCGASAPTVGRPCEASLRRAPGPKDDQGTQRPANSSEKQTIGNPYSLLPHRYSLETASRTTCVLPTWWLWRSGCTRSHSELGRETLQR